MIKRCSGIEKNFDSDCQIYDLDVQDIFGGKFYILYDTVLGYVKFIAKYKDYQKRRKALDNINCKYIIIQKYGEVIDVTEKTYNQIKTTLQKTSFNIIMPCKELMNIYQDNEI